jgi:hypothetical protein
VGIKVTDNKRGNEGVKLGGEDVWEHVASTLTRDLVVDVHNAENFFPGGDVEDHRGGGCHWVVKVVYNRDRVVDVDFNVGDHFTRIIRIVFGVVYIPEVVGSNPENVESKWIGV